MATITTTPASSSYSFTYGWTYDVFLSFRGADTRMGFTGNLYNALCQKGIKTFIDDEELRKGDEITPALIKAIKESRIAIVIFSKNYASSSFCLEELVTIMKYLQHKGRLVCPVFYQVEPSDVRHQNGSYAEALAKHETRTFDKEKIKRWRLALQQAANLSGFHFKHGYEYEFIGEIIQEVSKKINRMPLYVANYPVGLESRVKKVNSLLDVESNDVVLMVGIYGMGGTGKTTLAKAVYNSIADQFESLCFLADVRENSVKHGLVKLQETLLYELVGEKDVKLWNVDKGIPIIKNRFCQRKILLILDDVDKLEQLRALACGLDWFGYGSRIIITTRDQHLLHLYDVERTYEVEALNDKEAIELFSWNAFKRKEVNHGYMDISQRVINYCNGLPLSLETMSADLFGKTISQCKSALDTYERIPHESIQEILRVSYNGLKEFEKEIFLDIACFFKGCQLSDVINILINGRGFSPEYGISMLIDKCLIKIEYNAVKMHDLIEEMGREIVRQESPSKPGKRSRLWFADDILQVLEENKGSDKIEVIMLRLPKDEEEVKWDGKALMKMKNLKVLVIQNTCFSRGPSHLPNSLRVLEWWGYPEPSLPANYDPKKLAILDVRCSSITLDNQLSMRFWSLMTMNLSGCQLLKQVPDMSRAPNLKSLMLEGCENLVEVHDSVGFLDKLEYLNANKCTNLRILPRSINLTSLQFLRLRWCENLESFPEILGMMENLVMLDLKYSGLREIPCSIENLIGLECLNLIGCKGLLELPISIFMLPKLEKLKASRIGRIEKLKKRTDQEQETMSSNVEDVRFDHCFFTDEFVATLVPYLHNVTSLDFEGSNITILPACINACRSLRKLMLDECKELREIRGLPPNIEFLSAFNCTSLTSQSKDVLLSQALHEGGDTGFTEFIVPGSSIPYSFNHCTGESSLSFWFHNTLPAIFLCLVGEISWWAYFIHALNWSINGIQEQVHNDDLPSLQPPRATKIQTSHICLSSVSVHKWVWFKNIKNGWNHVEISCPNKIKAPKWIGVPNQIKALKYSMGVHIPEKHTSLVDFQFANPRGYKIPRSR